jgi:prolyl oligopeptidase
MRPDYPPTPTGDVVDDYHGTKVPDPYRWLEDPTDPVVRQWIDAQNRVTSSWLAEVPARDRIRRRLTELWDHPRAGAPWRRGARWFQLRNSGLQNHDVLFVMESPDEDGRVLLDPNTFSPNGIAALTGMGSTEDGRLIAYAVSEGGSDWMTWHVRDAASGQDRPDQIHWSKFTSAAWVRDGSGFFYAAYDPPPPGHEYEHENKHHKLYFHRLGTDQADDVLVEACPDEPEWGFSPEVTCDGRWLVISVWRGTERENRVHLIDLSQPSWTVRPLVEGFEAAYDFIGSDGDTLFFLTDHDAPRGRVVACDLPPTPPGGPGGSGPPTPPGWREVVPETDDALERATVVGGSIVAVYLHHAHHVLRRFTLDGEPDGAVTLPGIGSVQQLSGRGDDRAIHFTFESFTAPTAVYRHDLDSSETTLVRSPGLQPEQPFVTDQVFATSRDGTEVPLFITRSADAQPATRDLPVLLYGYGGFNIPLTPVFRVAWLVWLELGGVLAVANLRGGGEYGKKWHDQGRLGAKQNVFDDFLACAEWLVERGWTRPERLAIQGGSNGGLLVGACMTQRPDLFGACIAEVGVLDMLRFHHFTIGWGWASDYGTADDPEQFRWLHAYSPLHNVRSGVQYPPTLLSTGDHDDRVVPAHSFKFAAALQSAQAGDAPALIRIDTAAGHGLGKPTAKIIEEDADVLAFLVRSLGVEG